MCAVVNVNKLFSVAPRIDRKNLKDMSVKEGEPIYLDVKIFGEPAPEVVWTQNGKSISPSSHRRIENIPYNSKFFNDSTERKDTGRYKITATNKYGTDSVEIEMNIICKYFVS